MKKIKNEISLEVQYINNLNDFIQTQEFWSNFYDFYSIFQSEKIT